MDEEQAAPPPPAVELDRVLEMQDEPVSVPGAGTLQDIDVLGPAGQAVLWVLVGSEPTVQPMGRATSSSAPRCSFLLCSPHGLCVGFYLPLALCIPC